MSHILSSIDVEFLYALIGPVLGIIAFVVVYKIDNPRKKDKRQKG